MAYIHEGNGPALLANSIATLVITWLFSSIRVYVRWFMLKQWALEDWFFATSQLSFTILATISLLAAFHGNGQHLVDLKLADIPLAMEYLFIGEIVYALTVILIRLSFGFFLLHICVKKVHVWTIKATMAIMSLLTFLYLFFLIFQCSPTDYFWLQFSGISGSCMPPAQVEALTVAYAAMLCVTDLIFGILPIFVIWNLKMNPKAKVVVGILLALGMLGGLTVAIRIRYLQLVNLTEDFLFATANISIWSMIEPAISICCVAASTFRPLFSALSEKTSFGGYSANRLPLSNNKSANNNATGTVTSVLANAASRVSRGFRSEGKGWPLKGSGSQGHFKEGIALHSMATGFGGKGRNELDIERDGNLEFGKDGIHVSKSIEITRESGTEADR